MADAPKSHSKTIQVHALARVEGEGALTIRLEQGQVKDVQLRIYEPPRFYEAFLRGRHATEAPDITARICGICPVAYQMSAVHAIEKIFGVTMPAPLRQWRRLLYCGEWIESHVLHMFFLHLPDFVGHESAVSMAQANPEWASVVKQALRIKKAGNALVKVVGGREVHPINVKVGGFYRAPRHEECQALLPELEWSRDAMQQLIGWLMSLDYPDFEVEHPFVALRHPLEYPMNEGRVVSSTGLDLAVEAFPSHFIEQQVPHSNALQSRGTTLPGEGVYQVGPLARWNLNANQAPPLVQSIAASLNLMPPVKNPYRSLAIRGLEVLLALVEAIRIIRSTPQATSASVPFEACAGQGEAITEAPRGMLYHRYATSADGLIQDAVIIPPTSQNQRGMELDMAHLAPSLLQMSDEEASLAAERVIRNYDPCISCATHFLKFKVEGR